MGIFTFQNALDGIKVHVLDYFALAIYTDAEKIIIF